MSGASAAGHRRVGPPAHVHVFNGLNQMCPGIKINPTKGQSKGFLTAANGSASQLIGLVNLHWRFNGNSVVVTQDGTCQQTGLPMDYWYPVQVSVFTNLISDFLMTASLIQLHEMKIDYANNPCPIVSTTVNQRISWPL